MTEQDLSSDRRFQRLLPPLGDDPDGVDVTAIKRWLTPGEQDLYDDVRSTFGHARWVTMQLLGEISRLRSLGADMIVMYGPAHQSPDPEAQPRPEDDPRFDPLFPDDGHGIGVSNWLTGDELSTYRQYAPNADWDSRQASTCLRLLAQLRKYLAAFIVDHNVP